MLKPGAIISDRYEIIDNVGSGGMADVYKAKDQRLNRFVAIKVLKAEYSSDRSFVNKFRGEAQSAAGLSHPNIVNVYDVGDDSGLHYIVMELVEGITLKRFIERKGKLEVKEAVGITIQIAQGMEAAHDNHIIHRDIKPQNIIISREGKVKVTDFGIAKATNSNTITSNAMGSVHYLSPEQARGGYSDEKSDIYSLGVTLYEMLSGKVPFAGDNTVSVALLHIQGEAMGLRELDPSIPISVDKIVQKCMQKRPERRYHSASELILDLKRAIANPDGDFVQIPAFVASDSPTINISDDLGKIKNGTYLDESMQSMVNPKLNISDDDDELDTIDSKFDKFMTIGTIIGIVILGIGIIILVIWFLFPRGDDGGKNKENPGATLAPTSAPTLTPTPIIDSSIETYKFPYVLGYTKEDAETIIKAKDEDAFITWRDGYSAEYKEGQVMSQYPEADRDAAKGQDVIIYLSIGPESFVIPYVYGLTGAQAEKKLEDDYGLKTISDYQYSNLIEKDKVIETDPAKDSMVVEGDTIKIIISMGPEVISVPDLAGKTEETAKEILEGQGLVLGKVSHETSDTVPEGQIFYQSTTAGLTVDRGTVIDVSISKGPANIVPIEEVGGSGVISYKAYLRIGDETYNPLLEMSDGEAECIFELIQGEMQSEIGQPEMLSINDFPLDLEIEGESTEPGEVRLFINGDPYIRPGETEQFVWIVNFTAVED
ncbi:MAG TPA: Stk1 family PASTA domain-containing Ser/Thr kinase [Mobilitalea sp.]|nr:Stk1 family PASTA domain-containing Ser/Thr kinase [Mobilitalea sp.]